MFSFSVASSLPQSGVERNRAANPGVMHVLYTSSAGGRTRCT